MHQFDYKHDFGGGGAARASGGFYHLAIRSGSRASGSCARAAHDYITRTDEYDDPDRDEAIYTESDHMPSWAEDDPSEFWDAADLYERDNGRLYVSADFALPRDLAIEDQISLAHDFAKSITEDEHLPYTLAIHSGRDADGNEHNPHAHLMFSERQNDGIERTREDWFSRANSKDPEHGGAPKSRTFHGSRWVEQARERWADLTNRKLEECGRAERVDHRSYERQGVDREPGEHFGPAAAHMVGRGDEHDRLDHALSDVKDDDALRDIEAQITQLEAARDSLVRNGLPDDEREPERRDYSGSFGAGRSNDSSMER